MSAPKTSRAARLIALLRVHETKVRFIAAGILNTIFGLGIYPLLMWALEPYGLHYLVVLAFAQGISIVFSFLSNKLFVFQTRGQYVNEFRKFIIFHLANFAVNLLVLPILVELAKIPPVWAQLFFAFIVIISSYFWHSRITFHSRSPDR